MNTRTNLVALPVVSSSPAHCPSLAITDPQKVARISLADAPTAQRSRLSALLIGAAVGLIFASSAPPTFAQETLGSYDDYYPNHARGHVNNVFDANGFDNINLYNGNLTINLPLGPTLHPGGDVTLQVGLRYNSSIWANENRCSGYYAGSECDQYGQGALLGARHAGLGWSLEFGRIARKQFDEVFLVTPDGGEHQLFGSRFGTFDLGATTVCDSNNIGEVCYSRDGSDLKAERTATGWEVTFPTGVKASYDEFLDQYTHTVPLERDYVGRDFARMRDGWYCTMLEDTWANHIDITYSRVTYNEAYAHGAGASLNTDPDGNVMTQLIPSTVSEVRADGTVLRSVAFESERPGDVGGQQRPERITSVVFRQPGGIEFLRYNLSYAGYEHVERLQLQAYNSFDSDPQVVLPEAAKLTDWVYLLDGVSVSGSDVAYGFSYWTCADGPPDEVGPACPVGTSAEDTFTIDPSSVGNERVQGMRRGMIRQAWLPTNGVIDFDFDIWRFEHHTLTIGPLNDRCDIDALPGSMKTTVLETNCAPVTTSGLGVVNREVFSASDTTYPISRTRYSHSSGSTLALPVRFDSGNPDVPNPKLGGRDLTEGLGYLTSYSTTTVATDFVVDQAGSLAPEIGVNARSDESKYHFSLGTAIVDYDDNGWLDTGEGRTLPLTGALIYEQHFRGAATGGTPDRSVVHTYTVDDDALGWASTGPRYGTQVNRRPREVIIYYHGAASNGGDLLSITRFGYEGDLCSSSVDTCPNVAAGTPYDQAFTSHRTQIDEQNQFSTWSGGFSKDTMFDPLTNPAFDRSTQRSYWKDALAAGGWLLNRVDNQLVTLDGFAESESSNEYGLDRGELVGTRVYADPGGSPSSDDVVTRYQYVNATANPGYGQVRRRLVGLGSDMPDGADVTEMFPDVSEKIEYSHATPSMVWQICQEDGSASPSHGSCDDAGKCAGWTSVRAGFPAELQSERTIDPGWRLPTSVKDGNGNGIASIEYDEIGRVTRIQPTSSAMSDTWLSYTAMEQAEVKVENSTGSPQVVSRYLYDGLGRVTHEAKRQVGTTGLSYAGQDFLHRTFRYDGRGTQWRISNWKDAPDVSTGDSGADIVKTVDPFGRTEKLKLSDGSISEVVYSGASRTDGRIKDSGGAPLRSRTVTDLNARGNVIRVLEEKDLTTLNEDLENPPAADFVISSHTYDVGDRLTSVSITGLGGDQIQATQHRDFTYDARGFLTSETYPELGPGSIAYCLHDAMGAPNRLAYGATAGQCEAASLPGSIVDTVRDAGGRHLQTWVKQSGSWYLSAETEYGVNSQGNTIGRPIRTDQYNMVISSFGQPAAAKGCAEPSAIRVRHQNDYDHSQGFLDHRSTEVAFGADGSSHGFKTFDLRYHHDRWGNVSAIEYPRLESTNTCSPAFDIEASHDPMGLLGVDEKDGATALANLVTGITYSGHTGFMTDWQTPSGAAGNVMVHHRVTPDGRRLRVESIDVYPQGHAGILLFSSGDYAYDGAGNIKTIAGSAQTPGWTYSYDALLRLTGATSGATRSYAYDDFGNMTSIGGQSIAVSPVTNRLTAAGTAYDNRGNLIAEPVAPNWVRRSRYDLLNRQVAAWSTGSAAPSDVYGFAYDQAGERVLRYRVEGGVVQDARFFVRDEGGNVLSEFLWSPQGGDTGEWTRMADTAYLGRRPIVHIDTTPGGERRYTTLVADHLDSVRAEIYDAEFSNPSYSSIDYWPFGELVNHPATLETNHLFTAHEREFTGSATGVNTLEGVDYMHARYYSHTLGRFSSIDPVGGTIGSSQSWNRYSYVRNSPLKRIDPFGREEKIVECPPGEYCADELPDIDVDLAAEAAATKALLDDVVERRLPELDADRVQDKQQAHEVARLITQANQQLEEDDGLSLYESYLYAREIDRTPIHRTKSMLNVLTLPLTEDYLLVTAVGPGLPVAIDTGTPAFKVGYSMALAHHPATWTLVGSAFAADVLMNNLFWGPAPW